ncbi:MAG: EcsC family protein [Gammaproteobacteria bacterium]|nr:EcsC family protein [Gammaproteobacteria bacterium]
MRQGSKHLSDQEMRELHWAYTNLEHPSLAARLSNLLAEPLEELFSLLPKSWKMRLDKALKANSYRTVRIAIASMNLGGPARPQNRLHKLLVLGTGAAGGYFGPLSLLIELPVTTTLILRSIANIAHAQGEDLNNQDTRMACVQVFALGARTRDDEAADTGYYALRTILGFHFERDILEYASNATGPHIPAFIDFTRAVAARFGVLISDAAAVKLVPVAGAITGAGLNLIFMKHFQDVATGHFIVRRLERKHGSELIRKEYQNLMDQELEQERDFSPVEGW